MANILSQDEVDSLLDGIGDGKIETETDTPEKGDSVAPYDFSIPAGPVHLRLPALGIINERFVGLLRSSLPLASRSVIDVNLASTESVKFNEWSGSIPLPSSLNIFKIDPLRGYSLLVLEGALVFAFVDSSFGGKGQGHVKLEGRGFTPIETRIVEKIVKIFLRDLQQAWADLYPIKTAFNRSEMDPQFAAIVTPEDMVIVNKFVVQLENGSGAITICIPYSSLEPIREKLKQRFQGEKQEIDQNWRNTIIKKIKEIQVGVKCRMGVARINGRQLLGMKVNDVIALNQKITDPIQVQVEGIPKFIGYPGAYQNKKAARISGIIDKE